MKCDNAQVFWQDSIFENMSLTETQSGDAYGHRENAPAGDSDKQCWLGQKGMSSEYHSDLQASGRECGVMMY